VLSFVQRSARVLGKYPVVKIWQVENEPLDPAGPLWLRIDRKLLVEEVSMVKKGISDRKILINLWGGELSKRQLYLKVSSLADIVGLDIYFKTPLASFFGLFNLFSGPFDSDKTIKTIISKIKRSGKEVWLAELQAEPWEFKEILTKKTIPKAVCHHK
jgi:hypothetical protein